MENEEVYSFFQREEYKDIIHFQICGITYPDKRYEIIRYSSRVACIEYIEEGTGMVEIGDKDFSPSEGDTYFLQTGPDHHYWSDGNQPWKKYFLNVSGRLLESLIGGYGLNNKFHFKGLDIKDELCRMIDIAKKEDVDCTAELIGILNEIFLKMYNSVKTNKNQDSTAVRMKEFLNGRLLESFRMEELCDYIGKSESRCIQIFKSAYGITPYAYLLNEKINLAKQMLKNTNMSVKQIAYRLKFADEYYFSNVFKSKTGLSPLRYRKI